MTAKVLHDHHYVPECYQKRFLDGGERQNFIACAQPSSHMDVDCSCPKGSNALGGPSIEELDR
jgi:hypothetical protein